MEGTIPSADSSNNWCDSEFGWGPFVEGTNAFTICFCSTVFELPPPLFLGLFGIPALLRLSKEPFVNPASSWSFSLKLGLSATALLCSLLLAMFTEPDSPANTWAQSLTASGWLLSILMLVTGYLRARPQLFMLRLWWLTQLVAGCIVFGNHSILNPSPGVHIIRGISLFCVILLAPLSFYKENDVPKYQAIVTLPTTTTNRFMNGGNLYHIQDNNGFQVNTSSSSSSPLLVHGNTRGHDNSSSRFGLTSQLSQLTLYGADTSAFKGAISAWDEAISSSMQQRNNLPIHEEGDEGTM